LYDTGVGECVIVDDVGRDVFVGPRFPASVNDGCCGAGAEKRLARSLMPPPGDDAVFAALRLSSKSISDVA